MMQENIGTATDSDDPTECMGISGMVQVPIKVKCEICGFVLGTVDPDKLKKPLTGAMFGSISPGQFPAPFPPAVDWMWIRCPMCRKRPFQYDDRVMSANGKIVYACRSAHATPRESETSPEVVEGEEEPTDIKEKASVKNYGRRSSRAITTRKR